MPNQVVRFFTEDKPVSVVIVLNAFVLFLLAFDTLAPWHLMLNIIDIFFLIYFLLEAILKIRMVGWRAYFKENWNRFDFIIVLVSLPTIVLGIYDTHTLESNLTFLFVFRILRIFRFFKFLRFVPNIDELLAGIRRAFKASVFVVLAFFIYMFLIAMLSCHMFKEHSPVYFGNPMVSLYSIFKVFTIEGWYEIPDSITTNMNQIADCFTKLYFVLIVVSGGLFGLSIVNAIFVEEMVRDNNDDLMEKVHEMDKKIDLLLREKPAALTKTVEKGS